MAYYIMYPRGKSGAVKIATRKPSPTRKAVELERFGFAEGPLKTIRSVKIRLNQMNIPNARRPVKFRQ